MVNNNNLESSNNNNKQMLINNYNKKINLLYRQLGKNIYNNSINNASNQENKNIINKISILISRIKRIEQELEYSEKGYNINNDEEMEKIIKKPEKNKEGLMFLCFCKKCNVGNNPESTHCIECGEKL